MTYPEAIISIIPILITGAISIYAIRNTRKMKDLDIKENNRNRTFEIEKNITLKATDAMIEACFRLDRQIKEFAKFESGEKTKSVEDLYNQMKIDLDFIVLNKPYFPSILRNDIHKASDGLTNVTRVYKEIDDSKKIQEFTKARPILEKAKESIENMIDRYNMFDLVSKSGQ